jgi:hypothetical protein
MVVLSGAKREASFKLGKNASKGNTIERKGKDAKSIILSAKANE